jgi:hypothetical protein
VLRERLRQGLDCSIQSGSPTILQVVLPQVFCRKGRVEGGLMLIAERIRIYAPLQRRSRTCLWTECNARSTKARFSANC